MVIIESGKVLKVISKEDYAKEVENNGQAPQTAEECHDYGENIVLTCGMMDLQMNGGGGAQFNDDISIATIEKMREVCFRYGTTGFLPSMISASFDDV